MNRFISSYDWLAILLRAIDLLARPSPSNILKSFEAWDYESRLRLQLRQLVRHQMLERRGSSRDATLSLTANGRLAALGGVDPLQRWRRKWDGSWRFLSFDLPSKNTQLRLRLWRWLRASRFGFLQHSVWVSPDAVSEENLPLRQFRLNAEALLVIEGRPTGSATDADLVNGAWDFAETNRRYSRVLDLAEAGLRLARSNSSKPIQLRRWLAEDRETWQGALDVDPLLPADLLPADYQGRAAWELRETALAAMANRGAMARIM